MQQASTESLREKHRKIRAAFDSNTQQRHAQQLCERLQSIQELTSAKRIGGYLAIRGEISLEHTFEFLHDAGKLLYLPVLQGTKMYFAPWQPGAPLRTKRFGLQEPDVSESDWISPSALDVVLAPLVVFDASCNRVGQGGGFYDRAFAFKKQQAAVKPALIGVAHNCQREERLVAETWDVPLDMVVSERSTYRPNGH